MLCLFSLTFVDVTQAYSSGSSPSCSWLQWGSSPGSTLSSAGASSTSWPGHLSSAGSHIPENWRRSTGGGVEAGSSTVTEGVAVFAGGLLLDSDKGGGASMHCACGWGGSAGWISGYDTLTLEVRGEERSLAARSRGTGGSSWLSADDESVLSSSSSAWQEMKTVRIPFGHWNKKALLSQLTNTWHFTLLLLVHRQGRVGHVDGRHGEIQSVYQIGNIRGHHCWFGIWET